MPHEGQKLPCASFFLCSEIKKVFDYFHNNKLIMFWKINMILH